MLIEFPLWMTTRDSEMAMLKLLAARMERLSADSAWAHRASGVRGQVLRVLDAMESDQEYPRTGYGLLIEAAFEILKNAAREIS